MIHCPVRKPGKKPIGTKKPGNVLLDRMQCIGLRGLELSIPNCLTKVKNNKHACRCGSTLINYPVSWKSGTFFINEYINIVLQISIYTHSIIWFFKQSNWFASQLIDNGHTIHIDFVLFTRSNSEFGALSATEQSFDHACTAPIS